MIHHLFVSWLQPLLQSVIHFVNLFICLISHSSYILVQYGQLCHLPGWQLMLTFPTRSPCSPQLDKGWGGLVFDQPLRAFDDINYSSGHRRRSTRFCVYFAPWNVCVALGSSWLTTVCISQTGKMQTRSMSCTGRTEAVDYTPQGIHPCRTAFEARSTFYFFNS